MPRGVRPPGKRVNCRLLSAAWNRSPRMRVAEENRRSSGIPVAAVRDSLEEHIAYLVEEIKQTKQGRCPALTFNELFGDAFSKSLLRNYFFGFKSCTYYLYSTINKFSGKSLLSAICNYLGLDLTVMPMNEIFHL